MFTVLQKEYGSFENIFEARSVQFIHGQPKKGNTKQPDSVDDLTCDRVIVDYPQPIGGIDSKVLTYGSIYVMNSNGKTVAQYHLGTHGGS